MVYTVLFADRDYTMVELGKTDEEKAKTLKEKFKQAQPALIVRKDSSRRILGKLAYENESHYFFEIEGNKIKLWPLQLLEQVYV